MREVRIHIDTLAYTRSGLATREPLDVEVGHHHRVVLVRPTRQVAFAGSYGGFSERTSFPGPAILSLLHHSHVLGHAISTLRDRPAYERLQLFAHADAVGSESRNKALTDRRARATFALMTRDVQALLSVADDEDWPPELGQVILRCLGHDPGPVDGKYEELTAAATRSFQESYVSRAFHDPHDPIVHPQLGSDGTLGRDTMEALLDAFVCTWSPKLALDDFVEHAPIAGCGAYNSVVQPRADANNRRISLVVHAQPAEYPDAATCRTGDELACPVVDDQPHRCMWYREHVLETPKSRALVHHFEPSWLRLTNGAWLLSVLTNVPDGESVSFEVFQAESVVGPSGFADESRLGPRVMDPVTVNPVHGVAQVVWAPEDSRLGVLALDDAGQEVDVPTFRATHVRSGVQLHAPISRPRIVVLFDARSRAAGAYDHLEIELIANQRTRLSASSARPYTEGYDALTFSDFDGASVIDLIAHHGAENSRVLLAGARIDALQRVEASSSLVPAPAQPLPPLGETLPEPSEKPVSLPFPTIL